MRKVQEAVLRAVAAGAVVGVGWASAAAVPTAWRGVRRMLAAVVAHGPASLAVAGAVGAASVAAALLGERLGRQSGARSALRGRA